MKGAVFFHSRWGNCREVAGAIEKGLLDSGHQVELVEISGDAGIPEGLEFVVVGGPTRAGKATRAVRRFIKRNVTEGWKGRRFAAFGTGFAAQRDRGEPQSAEHIYWMLSHLDLRPVADPFKVAVDGLKGPLADGELVRSLKFGVDIGEALAGEGEWKVAGRPKDEKRAR